MQLPGRHARRSGWVEDEPRSPRPRSSSSSTSPASGASSSCAGASGGSGFERAVWEQIAAIPYGETESYGAIARALGRPDRARAVGAATGRNPLAIIVPCHRVIGSDGSLTGYAGGLPAKRALLELESGARQESLL